jgi:23S rRNA (pseudouridine1915-N3)-methyltransferase
MIKVKILSIKKHKEKWLNLAIDEYTKRMPNIKLDWIFAKDDLDLEKKAIIEEKYICLDEHGKNFTSIEFSKKVINFLEIEKVSTFIIGGSEGLPKNILKNSLFNLSLSNLTFPNQICRLLLVEQLYRSFEISKGSKYHK